MSLTKAKLFNAELPAEFVIFDFNPETVTLTCAADSRNDPSAGGRRTNHHGQGESPAGNMASTYRGTKPTTIKMQGMLDSSADPVAGRVQANINVLRSWLLPRGQVKNAFLTLLQSFAGLGGVTKDNENSRQPHVTFQWGGPKTGFYVTGTITNVTAKYLRFDRLGNATRATVDITMKEEVDSKPLTNPTSGGVSGAREHVVAQGETLQSLAYNVYGNPALWRRLADVNGINDPSRVKPGITLLLPPTASLPSVTSSRPR
jgi:hypothetical protein